MNFIAVEIVSEISLTYIYRARNRFLLIQKFYKNVGNT
jgi:hypothetical protein